MLTAKWQRGSPRHKSTLPQNAGCDKTNLGTCKSIMWIIIDSELFESAVTTVQFGLQCCCESCSNNAIVIRPLRTSTFCRCRALSFMQVLVHLLYFVSFRSFGVMLWCWLNSERFWPCRHCNILHCTFLFLKVLLLDMVTLRALWASTWIWQIILPWRSVCYAP